jgi:hypothetical protein
MQALFDHSAIEANQQGQKSEQQVKEIKAGVNPGIWLYGGLGVLGLGGCFYLVLSTLGGGEVVGIFGLLLALVGLFAALRGLATWNLRRKLLAEALQSADGTLTFQATGGLNVTAHSYLAATHDGRQLHPLGLAGLNPQLPPGDYRFYYLNTRNWLLAAAPLSSEAELRANLNAVLASALAYDLETFRAQARDGQLRTAEGLPKLETDQISAHSETEMEQTRFYCTLGALKFEISSTLYAAIIPGLPYRAYFHSGETGELAALEAV